MSVVYEVNLAVDEEIADPYRDWLDHHIGEMLTIPGFEGAELFIEESDHRDPVRYCVHYRLSDRAALDAYFRDQAGRMRDAGVSRFGDRFCATRRILIGQQR